MTGFTNYLVTKGGQLVRSFIRSPNYVAGSEGWTVNKDGSAEFNNVLVRGTIESGQFIGTGEGEEFLLYSGTPALNNLILSVCSSNGADIHGNTIFAGFTYYVHVSGTIYIAYNLGASGSSWTFIYFPAGLNSSGTQYDLLTADPAAVTLASAGPLYLSAAGAVIVSAGPLTSTQGTPAAPTLITTDTWHDITSGVPSGVSGRISYRLLPSNDVELDFNLAVSGSPSIGGGTYFATVLGAYIPVQTKFYTVQALEGGNWVPLSFDIDTGGNIHARNAGVATITNLEGNAVYPLGAV